MSDHVLQEVLYNSLVRLGLIVHHILYPWTAEHLWIIHRTDHFIGRSSCSFKPVILLHRNTISLFDQRQGRIQQFISRLIMFKFLRLRHGKGMNFFFFGISNCVERFVKAEKQIYLLPKLLALSWALFPGSYFSQPWFYFYAQNVGNILCSERRKRKRIGGAPHSSLNLSAIFTHRLPLLLFTTPRHSHRRIWKANYLMEPWCNGIPLINHLQHL